DGERKFAGILGRGHVPGLRGQAVRSRRRGDQGYGAGRHVDPGQPGQQGWLRTPGEETEAERRWRQPGVQLGDGGHVRRSRHAQHDLPAVPEADLAVTFHAVTVGSAGLVMTGTNGPIFHGTMHSSPTRGKGPQVTGGTAVSPDIALLTAGAYGSSSPRG